MVMDRKSRNSGSKTRSILCPVSCILYLALAAFVVTAADAETGAEYAGSSSPAIDGLIVLTPQEGQVLNTHHITVTALAQLGATVRLAVNGEVTDEQRTVEAHEFGLDVSRIYEILADQAPSSPRLTGAWSFVSVRLPLGPNQVQVTVMNGDYPGATIQRMVHVTGVPARIHISTSEERLPADGKSQAQLTITVQDEWGYPVMDGTFVTISLNNDEEDVRQRETQEPGLKMEDIMSKTQFSDLESSVPGTALENGQIVTIDADPNTWGTQLRTQNGVARATLRASKQVGEATVIATCSQISASKTIRYTTPFHPLILVGVADAQVGDLNTHGDTGGKDEPGLYHNERLAFYARGTLFNSYLLTGSYDSARKYQDKLFRDLDPERLYPLYGDSSSIFYEAQSSGKAYAKVEKDRSYALWGDYNTELSDNELAAYERSLNGARMRLENSYYQLTSVGAKTNRVIARDEIRGLGISGFYFLTKAPVIQGSEKIRIETRDRYHPEVVLRSELRYRYNDYDIDYEQGSIFFKQPVPGRDIENNPVWVVVIYETASASEKDLVVASHGRLTFPDIAGSGFGAGFGATIVDEDNDVRAYQLRGVDGSLGFPARTTLSAEFAESRSFDIKDNAWKVQLDSIPYKDLVMKAYYRDIGDKYDNPSGPISETGSHKYGANAYWKIPESGQLRAEHYRSEQSTSQTDITSTSLAYQHQIPFRSLTGSRAAAFTQEGAEQDAETDQPITPPLAVGGSGGLTVQAKIEDLILENNQESQRTRSTLVTGSLRYQVSSRLSAALQREQRILGDKQTYKPDATTVDLGYEIINGLILNLQHRIEDQDPLRLDDTTIGISSRLSESFSAYSKYQIGGVIEGYRNQALIGLRNRWHIREIFTANIAFERSKITNDASGAGDYDALSASAEYLPRAPIKGIAKYEVRRDFMTTKQNAVMGVDFQIYDGVSFIGKHGYYLDKQKYSERNLHIMKAHSILGLAFRPTSNNKLSGLARIDVRQEDNNIITPSVNSMTVIGSAEGFYRPFRQIQTMGKYALKRSQEKSRSIISSTLTDIYIGRLTYQFLTRWDIAAEYRMLYQHETGDKEYGYSAEIGIWPLGNVRMALGYNFRGSVEPDFPDSEYWAKGFFLRIETKFTE